MMVLLEHIKGNLGYQSVRLQRFQYNCVDFVALFTVTSVVLYVCMNVCGVSGVFRLSFYLCFYSGCVSQRFPSFTSRSKGLMCLGL